MTQQQTHREEQVRLANLMASLNGTALAEMTRPALEAATAINGKILQNAAAFNQEWIGFMNRRFTEDLAVPGRLAECRSLQEMQGVCSDYWQKTFAQYQQEFEQMAKMGQRFVEEAVTTATSQAETTARELRPGS